MHSAIAQFLRYQVAENWCQVVAPIRVQRLNRHMQILHQSAITGDIDIGVGEASIQAAAVNYGSVDGSGGVGDTELTVSGEKISSSGFIGKSANWTGNGDHVIEISVGVGDAKVTLE